LTFLDKVDHTVDYGFKSWPYCRLWFQSWPDCRLFKKKSNDCRLLKSKTRNSRVMTKSRLSTSRLAMCALYIYVLWVLY
jgi:hypothetical protein